MSDPTAPRPKHRDPGHEIEPAQARDREPPLGGRDVFRLAFDDLQPGEFRLEYFLDRMERKP